MSEFFAAIAPYLPPSLIRTVLAKTPRPGEPTAERFPAAVLFADISGFTPLSEALSERGAEGPEELNRLLNHYFGQIITLAEAEGGEVINFSGDAITVLFPALEEPLAQATRRAFQAAEAMQAGRPQADRASGTARATTLHTSIGPVTLGVKIAIGAGQVLAMQVGGIRNRWQYVIGGEPLEQLARASAQAQRGEIVLSPEARSIVALDPLPSRPRRRLDWPAAADSAAFEANLCRFVPELVQRWLEEGLQDWLAVLRPMSVLFAGVDGLDYGRADVVEQVHGFVRSAQKIIDRYEGILQQFLVDDKGTVLLALFGAPPYAHRDDALRALHCAGDLLLARVRVPPEKPAAVGPLHLAIGVATGHVFAGPVGAETRRTYAAIGDAVNLASRLMDAARQMGQPAPLCDFATYEQARTRLRFDSLAPLRVKGKAGLVRVYRPAGPLERSDPDELPGITMVGRQAERVRLEAALDAVQAGQQRILIVEGEAGIGKSRLLQELTRMARERGLAWLLGAGQSIERQTPYRAWRDLFAYYFGLGDLDEGATRQHHVRELVLAVAPEQAERLPLLNDVLGLGLPESELTASLDPALRQQSLSLLLVELLRAWARERPLILLLEDTHWLDSLSWELTVYVARALAASGDSLLLVLATRPLDTASMGTHHMEALRALAASETMALTTLAPDETVALVTTRLGLLPGQLPQALTALVHQRAEGNPFFAEELVFTLRDQGLIEVDRNAGRCTIQGDLAQASQSLPTTVQGLILARIDRLPPERQLVLKIAAVIGRTFAYTPLQYTLQQHTAISEIVARLKQHLDALEKLDLTPLDTPDPDLIYIFKHIITQEVAYETLLFAQRRQLHRTVAEWYEQDGETRRQRDKESPALTVSSSPYLPLLVHHYHHAGEADKERHYAKLAGEQAAAQFANAEAVRYLSRALELTPAEDLQERFDLLIARERVYNLQGNRQAQLEDLQSLEGLIEAIVGKADRSSVMTRQAQVMLLRARYAETTSDYPQTLAMSQQALEATEAAKLAGRPKDPEWIQLRSSAYLHWGRALMYQGHYSEAQTQFENALATVRTAQEKAPAAAWEPLLRAEIQCLYPLGTIAALQGLYAQARDYFEQSLHLSRQVGNVFGESAALNNLGNLCMGQERQAEAADYYEQAMGISRQIGHRRGEGLVLNNLGNLYAHRGDYARALAYQEQALLIRREIGDRQGEGAVLRNFGVTLLFQGNYKVAQVQLEHALHISREVGDLHGESGVLSNLGLILHLQGDHQGGRDHSRAAIELAQQLGERNVLGYALTHLGYALAGLGQYPEAAAAQQQALALRRELGQENLSTENLAGLVRAALNVGDIVQARSLAGQILAYLERKTLEGVYQPFLVYLTCYRAMQAVDDPRAAEFLDLAHTRLQEYAGRISDEAVRQSFLERVPAHRALQEAWQKL